MKAPSRLNSKAKNQKRIIQTFLIAVSLVVAGILLPSAITMVGTMVMFPVHITQQWFRESPSVLPMYLKSHSELIGRISSLENELAIAAGTDLTQQRLFEDNNWLRQLLGVASSSRIAAGVIARPTQLPYDTMQIDRGTLDGVKEGAPVYIGVDNVIGIVVTAAPRYSFVQLFTSPGFVATGFISGADVITTVEGFGSGVARVRVPQGVPMSVGDLVHLPSIDPGVFGRIEYIENRPSQPEQYGFITLAKPISGIHYVAVAREAVTPLDPPVVEERIKKLITDTLVVDTSGFEIGTSTASTTATSTAP